MTRRRHLPPVEGKTHGDHLSFFERYRQEAMASHTVDAFYVHHNAKGEPWLITMGSPELPTREQMIASYMMVDHEIIVGASWPEQTHFRYRLSREEAEQKMELLEGVWPTTRILCTSKADTFDRLDHEFNPKPHEIAA